MAAAPPSNANESRLVSPSPQTKIGGSEANSALTHQQTPSSAGTGQEVAHPHPSDSHVRASYPHHGLGLGGILDGALGDSEHRHQMRQRLWDRFRGKGRKKVSWMASTRNLATSSYLNVLILVIPVAWVGHFLHWKPQLVFALSFISIIPLEGIFEYGGEQMAMYCGKDLGDLITVTLNNAVEATLAILLLTRKNPCELKILQSTIAGVVLLHLLLVPGTAFLTGGARIWEQNLHPHPTQLNHTLLTIGVLSLLVPAAFFAAVDRGVQAGQSVISDELRHNFLQMSRGIAVILLCIYVASRIFLHNPPGDGNAFRPAPNAPAELKQHEEHLETADPQLNPYFCIVMLIVTIGIMASTAEWLVDSIEFVREGSRITPEWFGLILLPIVSFAADGAVAIIYFIRAALFLAPKPPATLAKARAIDLSIQFTLFWMPFLVLLAWWINKPLTLLFDLFEVTVLLGACFLVNYVTADAKTNWVEGFVMVSLYVMIALCAWFYSGQTEVEQLLECGSIAELLAHGTGGGE